MVVDLNFHKVIKYFFSIFFFFLFSSNSFSENFTFKKLVDLNEPWGSSFINNEELIITEKTGKIKIVNIISEEVYEVCLLYTSPSPRDRSVSRMPSSA